MTRTLAPSTTAGQTQPSNADLEHAYMLLYANPPRGLGMCGCGNPEEAFELVKYLLAVNPTTPQERISNAGAIHLVLSILTSAGLIEHGTHLGHSWVTDKGRYFQALLPRVTLDQIDDAGLPLHECTNACWKLTGSDA